MVITIDLSQPRLGAIPVDARPLEWTIQEIDEARAAPAPQAPAAPVRHP
jgi:hypothetical protein